MEPTNKESEAGGVESSNKKSFEPEQKHFPSHLIPGTQHPSSTFTVTLTQSEDGTYLPPPNLIGIMRKSLIALIKKPITNLTIIYRSTRCLGIGCVTITHN